VFLNYRRVVISEESVAQVATLLPQPSRSVIAVAAPGTGTGTWAGAPSAALGEDGKIYLAYRVRRPEGTGRGYAVAVARSDDGVRFETLLTIGREAFGAESLERPALVAVPGGSWRLYLSCATPGTKHWRVEMIEAADPAAFDARYSCVVLPGDDKTGVKDPVIIYDGDKWHAWASVHPLADPDEADQMATDYACSADGVTWTWQGTALSPRPGEWDARGTRVTAVRLAPGSVVAYYDGRATKAENFEERTGIATGASPSALAADGAMAASPYGRGGLRYVSILQLPDSRERYYYEMTRADGAHELRTELR
jgi:hypothetical protein